MSPYLGNAATFLVSTLFGIYLLVVMLRFLLQLVRADFYNPVSQFIVKVTNPPLIPLRRFIPGLYGLDTASLTLMFAIKFGELWLVHNIVDMPDGTVGLCVLALAGLLSLALQVFMFSIIIQVVISWINPGVYNPITVLLHSLTEPLMRPARRVIPPTAGIDLSPMVVIIALVLVSMLLIAPINAAGSRLL